MTSHCRLSRIILDTFIQPTNPPKHHYLKPLFDMGLWQKNGMKLLSYIVPHRTPYPSGTPEFTPGFQWGSCYSIFSFMCMYCRSLFVLLYFFFWLLCCLFFFDIRILITPLVFSNSSYC